MIFTHLQHPISIPMIGKPYYKKIMTLDKFLTSILGIEYKFCFVQFHDQTRVKRSIVSLQTYPQNLWTKIGVI